MEYTEIPNFADEWNFHTFDEPYIRDDIYYVGVNDYHSCLFEAQYYVHSMAYNSYMIMDDAVAVLDTVDAKLTDRWMTNIKEQMGRKTPNYLIVQHMEPDHSGSIMKFLRSFPKAKLVISKQGLVMLKQFYGSQFSNEVITVGEGDTLELGRHTLHFVSAPMVHWPEVLVTYDSYAKVLFSADAFGKFGAIDSEEYWTCEARRYYFGIVGKYGAQVQTLLQKASKLDIQTILPLHGPILTENISYYLDKYALWSSYKPEDTGVCIVYTSIYGNTRKAADYLEDRLEEAGVEVQCHPLYNNDIHEAIEDAFRYTHLVLLAPTYNGGVFPHMRNYIESLVERNYQGRTVALVENGSWAPQAGKVMKKMLEGCKDLTFMPETVTIRSALNEDSQAQLDALLEELKKVKK